MMVDAHDEHETDDWTIAVGDHDARADSPLYGRSRAAMVKAVQLSQPWYFGDKPYQDHHGGFCWVLDGSRTRWFRTLGIEWSAQFCADPAKVDVLRDNARALVDAFIGTRGWYSKALGMSDDDISLLDMDISTPEDVANWTDSFWNASWPLPQPVHTGTQQSTKDKAAGVHHIPDPIFGIQFFKRDDYQLFVTDPSTGQRLAVLPVAPYSSGDGRVRIAWHPSFDVETLPPESLVLGADHPLAHAAFVHQRPGASQ